MDRRIAKIEEVPNESDSEGLDQDMTYASAGLPHRVVSNRETSNNSQYNSEINSSKLQSIVAKQYVGELISRVDFQSDPVNQPVHPTFIQNTTGPLI